MSTASPKIFPTIGTALLTTAFAVLAVIPSTLLDSVPSIDKTPTKIVSMIPNTHTILDFINLASFSICTLSDIFETIHITAIISVSGIKIVSIKFPMKFIMNKIIGSRILLVVILPV